MADLAIVLVVLPGWIYLGAAVLAVRRFARRARAARGATGAAGPAVTILKPLHGDEPGLSKNLRSFADQDYPMRQQIVLGVNDPRDGALTAARALVRDRPGDDIALVIDRHIDGANHKVANLANMLRAARHDMLVLADSDMRVERGYLTAVTAPFADPRTGLVTCLYKAAPTGGMWSQLGALHINFGFLPGAILAETLGVGHGCFGATIVLRRQTLDRIGGFARFRDELADDHRLGEAVRAAGLAVVLSEHIVEAQVSEPSFAALWHHELRWARTVRGLTPLSFTGSIVTHPLALAVLAAAVTRLDPICGLALAISWLLRWAGTRVVAGAIGVEAAEPWLLPIRDILSFAVFVASFFGRKVSWRDRNFCVAADGRITADGDQVR
ncbi:MAG TPA: bacteriohopanetetrol glucosamine biosynthesis glycosyltransferase HpnI [Stellaceae bacterium]|nr:bacteriohopanetetrol glucosamine biosynthesis glycosyltransferase HpnI [Stellaceae bacterium]